jgi:Protein of unknown function (DUF1579)
MSKLSAAPVHRVAIALVALLSLASPAIAADKSSKKTDKAPPSTTAPSADQAKATQDAMMAEMAKYAAPGPMQTDFMKPLAGTWKTVVTTYMGPKPEVSEGMCTRSMILGDRFLESKHSGSFAGAPFEGLELLGFDTRKSQFSSVWVDNMGTTMAVSSGGSYDPATKTLSINSSFDDPVSGKPVAYKMVTHIVDPNKHVFTMVGNRDGKDFTEMEITYTRVQ